MMQWIRRLLSLMLRWIRTLPAWLVLAITVLTDTLVSSVRVAWDILTPRARSRPGILRVPLEVQSDAQITLLAHVITLSPGTLSLDVAEDRSALYVHVMFLDDAEAERRRISERLERRVRRVLP